MLTLLWSLRGADTVVRWAVIHVSYLGVVKIRVVHTQNVIKVGEISFGKLASTMEYCHRFWAESLFTYANSFRVRSFADMPVTIAVKYGHGPTNTYPIPQESISQSAGALDRKTKDERQIGRSDLLISAIGDLQMLPRQTKRTFLGACIVGNDPELLRKLLNGPSRAYPPYSTLPCPLHSIDGIASFSDQGLHTAVRFNSEDPLARTSSLASLCHLPWIPC